MTYFLLPFFLLQLILANLPFAIYFLINKSKYLFPLFFLLILLVFQTYFFQQTITADKNKQSVQQPNVDRQLKISQAIKTVDLYNVSPTELSLLKNKFEELLELKPDHAGTLFNLGMISSYQHLADDTNSYLQKSFYQNPSIKTTTIVFTTKNDKLLLNPK